MKRNHDPDIGILRDSDIIPHSKDYSFDPRQDGNISKIPVKKYTKNMADLDEFPEGHWKKGGRILCWAIAK
jgi:hypothetical protein